MNNINRVRDMRCDTASNSFEREEEQDGGWRAGVFPIGGQKWGNLQGGTLASASTLFQTFSLM